MSTLKTTLAASAVAIAGLAGTASAQDLTAEQEQALTLFQAFNTCVEEGYAAIENYQTAIEQYAVDNGYMEQIEELVSEFETSIDSALSDGILTDEEYASVASLETQIIELEEQVVEGATSAGIAEPDFYPEDTCYVASETQMQGLGVNFGDVQNSLSEAYDVLGEEEFINRVAPTIGEP